MALRPAETPPENTEVAPPAADASDVTAWARAAAHGDTVATARLLKALAPRLIRTVRVLMGPSHPDVDDVIQQALIALVQALPRFRGECSPAHYASRIVVRTAVAARHRARRAGSVQFDATVDVDAVPVDTPHAGEEVLQERQRALVRELLDELPPEQAEVIALRIGLGLSWEEMAAATGTPLNTLRSRIRRAKLAVRRRIEADPMLASELDVEP
jgi:RNA polymerase sigma factor (sigma-70 family)